MIPDNANSPYDMKELITTVIDEYDFFELQPDYAKNIIIGFLLFKLFNWAVTDLEPGKPRFFGDVQ